MPIILWLLGVPIVVIALLYLLHVIWPQRLRSKLTG